MSKFVAPNRSRFSRPRLALVVLSAALSAVLLTASSSQAALKWPGTNHARSKNPIYRLSKTGGLITHKTRVQRAAPSKH